MKSDKPWYDDLRAIGSQAKAGFDVDLPAQIGQAAKAFSPEGSVVDRYGQEMIDNARQRDKENAEDLEGRGTIANALIKGARGVTGGIVAPLAATLPVAVSPLTQAAMLAVLYGGSEGQKTYDKMKADKHGEAASTTAALASGGVNAALGGLGSPYIFSKAGLSSLTPSVSAEISQSAARAMRRGFARMVNESGLATRKYDKFAANVADIIDKLKTVSTQGVPALPKPDA